MARVPEEKTEAMKKKGLVLLSGGLDSTLATKVILEQGIELEAVNFTMSFYAQTKNREKSEAERVAEDLGINLKVIDVADEYLDVVKKPRYGYGSNINPCIDCRIFMLKKARDYMEEAGASFIITGEVLGERPMSQRSDMIRFVEKKAGLNGLIVRPLSAKLLEPSLPEKEGVIDRDKLLNIHGRSRKPQMELATRLNVVEYQNPAGGCLLTDPGFSKKVKDLLAHNIFNLENIELLKVGRHFRMSAKAKLVVGRNKDENERLLKMAMPGDILLDAKEVPSPIAFLRGEDLTQDILESSCGIITRYSDSNPQKTAVLYWRCPDGTKDEITASPATEDTLNAIRI